MTTMILSQTSRLSSGAQLQSLSIAPSIAPPLFIVITSSASPVMSTAKQKSFERFVHLSPLRFDGTPSDRTYDCL